MDQCLQNRRHNYLKVLTLFGCVGSHSLKPYDKSLFLPGSLFSLSRISVSDVFSSVRVYQCIIY